MLNFFKKKKDPYKLNTLKTDLHSHLLPALDDGVESFDESVEIIKEMRDLGFKKIITTPHIMKDFYDNSIEAIKEKANELKLILKEQSIDVTIEVAAEYYLDEHLLELIDKEDELLTFGDRYLLFETSFMNQPFYLNDFIFKAKSRGFNPVLAHPERYAYIQSNPELVDDLITRGVFLQLNINSISGYYSKPVKKMAEKLIDSKKIHFLGSDCHNKNHLNTLKDSITEKYFRKALSLRLLNHSV